MDITAALEALRAVRVLEALASGHLTTQHLDALGYRDAGAWTRLATVYFGPTRHRRLQHAARGAAADLSLDALMVVERHTRKLLRGAALSPWELRVELSALRGTVAEIDRQAAARVRELNRAVDNAESQAHSHRALKGGKNTDGLGLRTITMTGPERHITSFLAHLRPTAEKLRRADPRLSHEQALFDAVFATGGGPTGPVPPVPLVVATVPEGVRLLRREGDDTVFGLTDGTTMTGSALVQQIMDDHHYVGLYDPVEGPVDLYRSRRTASLKQRILLAGESLLCEGPECTTAADECEVHHLTAWSQGGDTNVRNLTMVCRVHNARNDDDPNAPPRNGRLERRPGGVVFLPPDGGPPRTNRHPLRNLSARGLLNA